ncbi:DUF6680 family protein [Salaquimonas pukyongi]|uniref:DUF6680 family protein n=1 Tax=Salaquimonas pukyongi TaxID=2712698 RepID=UPI00096B7FF5|nr:DUF6680 family protein [Salaquimonas pukyongi]
MEYITIIAILLGPIIAVLITRYQDARRANVQRKLDVFRSLMKTRKTALDHEHVGALNLIELEFYKHEKVVQAYRAYIDFRYEPEPNSGIDDLDRHNKRGENLLYDLLSEIGRSLGYTFDKDDLKRFSYSPQGWNDDQAIMRKNARLLNGLLEGKIALPITPMPPQQDNPFPPPPIDEKE